MVQDGFPLSFPAKELQQHAVRARSVAIQSGEELARLGSTWADLAWAFLGGLGLWLSMKIRYPVRQFNIAMENHHVYPLFAFICVILCGYIGKSFLNSMFHSYVKKIRG